MHFNPPRARPPLSVASPGASPPLHRTVLRRETAGHDWGPHCATETHPGAPAPPARTATRHRSYERFPSTLPLAGSESGESKERVPPGLVCIYLRIK